MSTNDFYPYLEGRAAEKITTQDDFRENRECNHLYYEIVKRDIALKIFMIYA